MFLMWIMVLLSSSTPWTSSERFMYVRFSPVSRGELACLDLNSARHILYRELFFGFDLFCFCFF